MKTNRYLSIIALIFSLFAIALVAYGYEFNITDSGFIGLGIAIMGVLSTFIVGYQIFNSLEIRNKIQEIHALQKQENERNEKFKKALTSKEKELDKRMVSIQADSFTLEVLINSQEVYSCLTRDEKTLGFLNLANIIIKLSEQNRIDENITILKDAFDYFKERIPNIEVISQSERLAYKSDIDESINKLNIAYNSCSHRSLKKIIREVLEMLRKLNQLSF